MGPEADTAKGAGRGRACTRGGSSERLNDRSDRSAACVCTVTYSTNRGQRKPCLREVCAALQIRNECGGQSVRRCQPSAALHDASSP